MTMTDTSNNKWNEPHENEIYVSPSLPRPEAGVPTTNQRDTRPPGANHSNEYYLNAAQEDPLQKKQRRRTRRRARMAAGALGGVIVGAIVLTGGCGVVVGGVAGAVGARVFSKRAEKRKDAKIEAALNQQSLTPTVY